MPTPRDPDAHPQAAGLPTSAPARTWDTPAGPMVEPPPDPAIDAAVHAALAELDDTMLRILEQQGRHVSDRLAAEAQQRRDRIDSSIAISEYVKAHHPDRHNQPTAAELERRRSTFNGHLDERHLALRADPDRGRARRRRAA